MQSVIYSMFNPYIMSMSFLLYNTPTSDIYTLSLHDALPIFHHGAEVTGQQPLISAAPWRFGMQIKISSKHMDRSEEHTSELQSRFDLVCRLLLEKKKK